jgi:LmbE family N-acetylglucosaminyl deacetylase
MKKTLLTILAHPDDESFGPGGTLAHYARAGVAVHCLCGTRGESGTVDAEKLKGFANVAELRTSELMCAAKELQLAGVHFLGYRDSGMVGSADNALPDSLHAAPLDDVAQRIIAQIDALRPDTIVTHDQFGGYGHPDHIKLHLATLRAYKLKYGIDIDVSQWTSDTKQPQVRVMGSGPAPRLYFATFPKGMVRLGVKLMPLLGQDPARFGRNKDLNLRQVAAWDVPTTAEIDTRAVAEVKTRASACHASQQQPPGRSNFVMRMFFRRYAGREFFSRVYPVPQAGTARETDLFLTG